jgi:hypothetical protein
MAPVECVGDSPESRREFSSELFYCRHLSGRIEEMEVDARIIEGGNAFMWMNAPQSMMAEISDVSTHGSKPRSCRSVAKSRAQC